MIMLITKPHAHSYSRKRLRFHFGILLIVFSFFTAAHSKEAPPVDSSSIAEVTQYLNENAEQRPRCTLEIWAYFVENSSNLSEGEKLHFTEMLCLGLNYDEGRPFALERLSLPPIKPSFFNENSKVLIKNVRVGQVSDNWLVRAYAMADLDISPIINQLDDTRIYSLSPAAAPERINLAGSPQWIINIYNARRGKTEAVQALLDTLKQRPLEYWGQDGMALMDLVFTNSEPLLNFVKKILLEGSDKEEWHGDMGYASSASNAACALASSGDTPVNYWRGVGSPELELLRRYYRHEPGPITPSSIPSIETQVVNTSSKPTPIATAPQVAIPTAMPAPNRTSSLAVFVYISGGIIVILLSLYCYRKNRRNRKPPG
jgi:hypothetical protein